MTINKHFLLYVFTISLISYSCDNSLEDDKRFAEEKSIESYINTKKWTYTKSNGVYHIAQNKSYGYEVSVNDTVWFWYKGYTISTPSVVFDTNIKEEAINARLDTLVRKFEPIKAIVGKTALLQGLTNGLLLCREGQKATIIFPSNLGYKDNAVGPIAPTPLAFDIEIVYLNGARKLEEQAVIASLNTTGYVKHTSGLYYKYLVDTNKVRPTENSMVYGTYTIKLMNGESVESFSTQNGNLIDLSATKLEAIRIGYTLTSLGGTVQIISPSPLAYGKKGSEKVPPYTPVEITIKLDSIKNN